MLINKALNYYTLLLLSSNWFILPFKLDYIVNKTNYTHKAYTTINNDVML